jgi:4-hydroxy 2-oxovalerate aldolase
MSINILDCTLRDGGYYNNWDFPKELVDHYLETMSKIGVDYIELGFRGSFSEIGSFFGCPYT